MATHILLKTEPSLRGRNWIAHGIAIPREGESLKNKPRRAELETVYEFAIPVAVTVPPVSLSPTSNINVQDFIQSVDILAAINKDQISHLLITDLRVYVYANGLVENLACDLQTSNGEVKQRAVLVFIYCTTYRAMKNIHSRLVKQQVGSIYIQPFDDHVYLGLDIFVKTHGVLVPHFGTDKILYELKVIKLAFKSMSIDVSEVYKPYGPYLFTRTPQNDESAKTLTGFSFGDAYCMYPVAGVPPPDLHTVLPVVSFDIEAIADSMDRIPMGGESTDRLSSLVLYCRYGGAHYMACLFLLPEGISPARGREFCEDMTRRYGNVAPRNVCQFTCYTTESALLKEFKHLYLNGGIFKHFSLPWDIPHVFCGHNIIGYDIPFIHERFKYWNMHEELLDSAAVIMRGSDKETINLNKYAILLDLMILARANQLSGTFTLSAVAKARLPAAKVGKVELDSVTIRLLYAAIEKGMDDDGGGENKTVEAVQRSMFALEPNIQPHQFVSENRLNFAAMPVTRFQTPAAGHILVPTMESILIYNIQDTITVTEVLIESKIFPIITELALLFGIDLENASMQGNSRRIKSCMMLHALKAGVFLQCRHRRFTPKTLFVPLLDDDDDDDCEDLAGFEESLPKYLPVGLANLALKSKGYKGALNYANQGIFSLVESFDFTSYYPNLTRTLDCDYGSCDILEAGQLESLNSATRKCGYDRVGRIQALLSIGALDLYSMEDPELDVSTLLDPRYRGAEIGHCLTWNDVESAHKEERILVVCRDAKYGTKDSFLTKLITQLLAKRAEIKTAMKSEKDFMVKIRLDSKQLSYKILLNSMYGLKGNKNFSFAHVPLSAAVTMLGRKYLTVCSRLIICEQILYSDSFGELAKEEALSHKKHIMDYTMTWKSRLAQGRPCATAASNESVVFQCEPPALVCYVDTDGIKYSNELKLNPKYICQKVNATLRQCLGVDYLELGVEETAQILFILTKKSYAYFNLPDKIEHKGYEKNVHVIIKQLLNGIVDGAARGRLDPAKVVDPFFVVFGVFDYLAKQPADQLIEKIKLNRHKNDSKLQQFIRSVTKEFRGDIKAMLLLNAADVNEDCYISYSAWCACSPRPKPNLLKFIRKNTLIMLRLIFSDTEQIVKFCPESHLHLFLQTEVDTYGRQTQSVQWNNFKHFFTLAFIERFRLSTSEGTKNGEYVRKWSLLQQLVSSKWFEFKDWPGRFDCIQKV